jgi:cyanophycinase
VTGAEDDANVAPAGPGLILMGGGPEVDAAFEWWKPYVNGGDVVILRATGADGYNDYLYSQIGGLDSVETMIIDTKALSNSDYVAWTISHAEGIFMAGGDQSDYMTNWKDSAVEGALNAAYARGAVIGGTSAGLAVLGEFVYAAHKGSVTSDEAMADPYSVDMTLDKDFLSLPLLKGVITDSHFYERDRMGRLVTFLARVVKDGWVSSAVGVGVDEETALVVDPSGSGQVLGIGAAYVVRTAGSPAVCEPGTPLDYQGLSYRALFDGDTVKLPAWDSPVPEESLSVQNGKMSPPNPY